MQDQDQITLKDVNKDVLYDEAACDRFSARLEMLHEHCGDPPVAVHGAFQDICERIIQPLPRRHVVGEDWKLVDLGWFEPDQTGYIVIQNKTGEGRQVNPTAEEQKAVAQAIVEVGCQHDVIGRVRPGRFAVMEFDSRNLRIRTQRGVANVTITIYPR